MECRKILQENLILIKRIASHLRNLKSKTIHLFIFIESSCNSNKL